jgi:hypothetical protein
MAALTGLNAQTNMAGVAAGGAINEDLSQKIWDVSRIPLPGLDAIGRGTVSAARYSWVRDRLAAPAANAVVENATYAQSGASATDFISTATAPLNRFVNQIQISVKAVAVSEMSSAISTPGGIGGLAENVIIAQRELMRDVENHIFNLNQASVVGVAASTAAQTASMASVIDDTGTVVANTTGINAGSGITFGGWNGTDLFAALGGTATAAAIAEADIRAIVLALFKNGACDTEKALVAMGSPEVKQVISQYMYTSTARIGSFLKMQGDGSSDRALSNVEFIQTDYGLLRLIGSRFMGTMTLTNPFSNLWIFDPGQFELVTLKGMNVTAGQKSGLVDVRWANMYWGTRFHPEACGAVVGIDSALAMTAT